MTRLARIVRRAWDREPQVYSRRGGTFDALIDRLTRPITGPWRFRP